MVKRKQRPYAKYFLSILLAVSITAAPFSLSAMAEGDIDSYQSQKQQLEQESQELDKKLQEARQNTADQEAQKKALDNKIVVVQQQIALTNQQIEALDGEIAQKQQEMSGKQAEIDIKFEQLKQRLRAIYVAGETSTLDLLLGAKNLDEFMDKAAAVKYVSAHDAALMDGLRDDLQSIAGQKQEIEARRDEVAAAKKELDQKKAELTELQKQSEELLNQMRQQENEAQQEFDKNSAELQEIERMIKKYYEDEQERLRLEEELRRQEEERRREEEEKNQNSQTPSNPDDGNQGGSSTPSDPSYDGKRFTWPLPGIYHLSSEWGDGRNHQAIDIAGGGVNIHGRDIVAAADGIVIAASQTCPHDYPKSWAQANNDRCGGGYGNYVMIAHADGYMTVYGHCTTVAVSVNQAVKKGQVIGQVGSTGQSTGYHLHYEVRQNGVKINPMQFYD